MLLCLTNLYFLTSNGQTTFQQDIRVNALQHSFSDPVVVFAGGTNGNLAKWGDLTYQFTSASDTGKFMIKNWNRNKPTYISLVSDRSSNLGYSRIGFATNDRVLQIRQEANDKMEFYTNATLRMTVGSNGWVGINTSTADATASAFISSPTTTGPPNWGWTASGGGSAAAMLTVNGDLQTTNSFDIYTRDYYIYSDERLKQEFNPLNDWRKILAINSYSFKYIEKPDIQQKRKSGNSFGFKAQEVYKSLPELTSVSHGLLAVNYVAFIPFLLEGLKEHDAQLREVEKIVVLESENKALKERLDKLETQLLAISNSAGNKEKESRNSPTSHFGVLNTKPIIEQNEPNPYTNTTEIRYFLPEGTTNAIIKVTALDGKLVGEFSLINTGWSSISINARMLNDGTYYYSLIVNNIIIDTKKMILFK